MVNDMPTKNCIFKNRLMKTFLAIISIIFLAGCATTTHTHHSAPLNLSEGTITHTVVAGDTLYAISKRYGVSLDSLMEENHIDDPTTIERGQVLRITGVAGQSPSYRSKKTRGSSAIYLPSGEGFSWPVSGTVTSLFGMTKDGVRNKGIDIRAGDGASVRAARSGRIVYCDTRHKGFGKTIIIDHGDNYQTVYSYTSEILVKTGDNVRKDEIIARAGQTGRAKEPSLHFEIRRDGEPINPAYYLPK